MIQEEKVKRIVNFFPFLLFFSLLVWLFVLQIIKGNHFWEISKKNVIIERKVYPLRGRIFDRNGIVVADVSPVFVLVYQKVRKKPDPWEVEKLGDVVGMSPASIWKLINSQTFYNSKPTVIKSGLSKEQVAFVLQNLHMLPGFFVETVPKRYYPCGDIFAHVVGYVGYPTKDELRSYRVSPDEVVGKMGIEKSFETYLHGEAGAKIIEIDAKGYRVKILKEKASVPGYDLFLTIDFKLQKFCKRLISKERGCIIALNPENGEILSMVSSPSFNPNIFTKRDPKEIKKILNDKNHPLINRCVAGLYPPGSTFKPAVALAALLKGITDKNRKILSTGIFRIGNYCFHDWKKGGHGETDLIKAIAESVNTYFFQLSYELGPDPIVRWAKKLGLGEKTGVELPEEKSGVIPCKKFLRTHFPNWYLGDTLSISIGQGPILVTPIQMAKFYEALTPKSLVFRPHLVRVALKYKNGKVVKKIFPLVARKLYIPNDIKKLMLKALRAVVVKGTAKEVFEDKDFYVAGKTGTAQNPFGKAHAWFIGFAPYNNPKILITVLLENGGGSKKAAEIAKKIFRFFFEEEANGMKRNL